MTSPLLSLKKASISFGLKVLFNEVDIHIYDKDRICLVGKNGEGKTTLMKIIAGINELDKGELWILPGIKIGYLPQTHETNLDRKIVDFVLEGIANKEEIEHKTYLADLVLTPLGLDKTKLLKELSGGQLRRAHLAKALIDEPDILMLDEPTNHLDIETIEWLEGYLNRYSGAIICISHDRSFLKNISNKTFWIDRTDIRTNNKGYEDFDDWTIRIFEQEQKELQKMERKLEEEEDWRSKGVTARRKRNQRRLHNLYALREKLRAQQNALNRRNLEINLHELQETNRSKFIAEFEHANFKFGDKAILKDFNFKLMKGDKVGIIGVNGSGKTSFIKMLTKELQPESGRVRHGKNLEITLCDQYRSELDPDETLWSTLCPNGGDHIQVGDKQMHVVAYLKNFMFDPKSARDKVATLSGGQANRLMLAKVLANPGGLLILDEPTNDLDVDTLDMIQEILSDYQGTLVIVSHDRDFLDRIITKTLIFEGEGKIVEYYGSYVEYKAEIAKNITKAKVTKKAQEEVVQVEKNKTQKLTYSLQRELDMMPQEINKLDARFLEIEELLKDQDLFTKDPESFSKLSKEHSEIRIKLDKMWERWSELERMSDEIS